MGATMYLARLVRAGLVLTGILIFSAASAQQNADNQLKEVQLGPESFTLGAPVPSWVDPTTIPEISKSQPIVIRLADTQYLVDQAPVVYVRRATFISDAASLSAAGRFAISFAPEYERVQLHAIHLYRGGDRLDRTTTSNIRFLRREQGLEQGVYSGRVTASILLDDVRVGDTLDISYSIYGQNPVFGGKFSGNASWDQSFPTLLRRVVFNYPVDRQIAWRMIGDRPAQPVVPTETVRDGMRKIAFEQRSLPETVSEAQVYPDFFGFRFLQFSEFSSWGDVANWANELFQTKVSISNDLQEVVQKIRTLPSDEARVTAALEFVQSEIRYFSVSLGESSHRPAAPDVVLRRRYGDCKDKSFLLIALLRELGIQSRPVLLQIGRRTGLEKTLPSAQFFDHAIVQVTVDGKTFLLDPTRIGQHGRLDRMGQAHEGAQTLVVAPETRQLTTISTDNIKDIVNDETQERATLSKLGGEGQLDVRRVWNGLGAEHIRVAFEHTSHEKLLRWIGDALERRYPGAKLVDEPVIHDDPVNNVFSIAATYKVPNLAINRDGTWVVFFKPDNMQDVLVTSPSATRTTPLRISAFPYQGKYSFEMTFPEEVSVIADPRAQTVENKYFSLTATGSFRGNIAKTSVELATLDSHVEAEDYLKYSEDLRSANKAIGGFIAVNKSVIKSTDPSATNFPQRLRELRQETIKKATETIGNGKLTGSDLADAYCLRGNALGDLGRHEEAFQDANEAVRLAPNAISPLTCRAELYFQTGQFEKSIADYSKAISLGGTEAFAFRGRGVSRFYAGRLDEASTDFLKADEIADKETRTYCDVWLILAYARLGKAIPDAVATRLMAEAGGEWPRPALTMLTGAMAPENMLKLLEEKKGDERHMALSEAYFYLGQHYLIGGDKNTARAYFEKARELGVIIYTEHIAAGFELQRLADDGPATPAKPSPGKPVAAQ
jgi:lipoprotein NlpI/transglutaminase-like putative cysteine protease